MEGIVNFALVRVNAGSQSHHLYFTSFQIPMASSCSDIREDLIECIKRSDCMKSGSKTFHECIKESEDSIGKKCVLLRQALYECKRGQVRRQQLSFTVIFGSTQAFSCLILNQTFSYWYLVLSSIWDIVSVEISGRPKRPRWWKPRNKIQSQRRNPRLRRFS